MTEAAVESLASENAARFAAMGAAHDNVSKKLEQLRQDARQARQSEITTELLDLVTGAEAQHDADPRHREAQRTQVWLADAPCWRLRYVNGDRGSAINTETSA